MDDKKLEHEAEKPKDDGVICKKNVETNIRYLGLICLIK